MKVHFRIKRFNPERDSKSYWGDYDVDADPLDPVLGGPHPIKWDIDGTPAPPEGRQAREERARFDDTTKCILCAACTTSCPIYWANGEYVGPAAIVNAHRFIFDSRDQAGEERLGILAERSGAFRRRPIFNCTDACPRGIEVTRAIQDVKRALIGRL